MARIDILAAVQEQMRRTKKGQAKLAAATGYSQGHLSKILSRKIALSRKAEAAFEDWLRQDANNYSDADVRRLARELLLSSGERRSKIMQIMQILIQLGR